MPTVSNITTLNQLIGNLSDIADKHQLINGFRYGDAWEFYSSGVTRSPEMWVTCTGGTRQTGVTVFDLIITLADNSKRGEAAELDIESDLVQIAEDIIAQMRNAEYGWSIDRNGDIPIKIMTEKSPKNFVVAEFSVSVRIKKADDRCSIPFSSDPTTGAHTNNQLVTIYNLQTNVDITTLSFGARYGVYQFDTINGGNASTNYTDIIVSP